ncbi:AAA family ATPase [Alteromonas gilva]|uniref:ATP-binding protein n=1 Tax=Alteromonas gilva TaxID=2987522 RepID=A0ABT5L2S8_9ALTE|nr:ATP-binding protein [Alteromonas gilva]MDC8831344.1 ATP-binding protein [Alteromonas gilva]
MNKGTLTFFCGKMGSGKSTRAREIARQCTAVLLSEDEWLSSLYPNKIATLSDYIEYSNLLKPQIKALVQSILACGTNVVMDFPANTISQRNWFRSIFAEINAPHCLVYIEVADAVCLKQIQQRSIEQPQRAKTDTAEMFEQVTRYFVAPTPEEGFTINSVGNKA